MPHFPQLSTGCLAQYPLRILHRRRTVVNEALGGDKFSTVDAFVQLLEWDLPYRGLSPAECAGLRELFESCEGRLGEFVFVDPFGNLLARSEQFDQAPWASDPQLAWTSNAVDPFGGHAAMRAQNNSGSAQSFKQIIQVPVSYETCFSIWIKSSSAEEVVVQRTSGPESVSVAIPIGGEWRRIETAAALPGTAVGVELTVEIPGAAAVEVFGAQLEAQRHASGYKRSLARAGIYPAARFAQDELVIEGDGFQTLSTRVRVIAQLAG